MPREWASRMTPSAIRSEPQMMAVCPASRSLPAATRPPSAVKIVRSMLSWLNPRPRKADDLRWVGRKRAGPTASPMRSCPSDPRCVTDAVTASASEQFTNTESSWVV